MIEYWPESQSEQHVQFEQFRTSIQERCTDVRFALVGGNILVVGTVPQYSLKASIDTAAREYGLIIQNCVRVVPGREWFAPETYGLAG
jgi:hypothetical protein